MPTHPPDTKIANTTLVRIAFLLCAIAIAWLPTRTIAAAGDLDTSFDPNPPLVSSSAVWAMARQGNGKIIVGGNFYPTTGSLQRNKIARLNTDGSLDLTFDAGGGPTGSMTREEIYALAIQPDGKILVGGDFKWFNGVRSGYLVRLNTNGSLDTTFNVGVGFDSDVHAIAIQPDRKILVGGWFSSYKAVPHRKLIRLNPNGSIDNTFNVGAGPGVAGGGGNRPVRAIHVSRTGKILVGGWWSEFGGAQRQSLVRINANGTVDQTFNANITTTIASSFPSSVLTIAVDANGKVLIGGVLEKVGGADRGNIARLESNGALDASFDAQLWSSQTYSVRSITVQPNGKILASGGFRRIATGAQNYGVARFNPNGSLDNTFNPVPEVAGRILLQPDSKILVAGGFTTVHGTARSHVARLLGDQTGATTGTATPIVIPPTRGTVFPSRAHVRITLALGLFNSTPNLGNGWKWVSWFGRVHTTNAPWFYHAEHGWLYSTSNSENDIWFYQPQTGWIWTSRATYPLFYRNRDRTWLGYMHGTTNPRWFWNYTTNQVEYIN